MWLTERTRERDLTEGQRREFWRRFAVYPEEAFIYADQCAAYNAWMREKLWACLLWALPSKGARKRIALRPASAPRVAVCTVLGCVKPARRRGLCQGHLVSRHKRLHPKKARQWARNWREGLDEAGREKLKRQAREASKRYYERRHKK